MNLNCPIRNYWKQLLSPVVILLLLASLSIPAQAGDGDLDPTFGNGGTVVTDLGGADNLYRNAVQPDGKIVAIGFTRVTSGNNRYALVRYNFNGTLDPTFGNGGKVVTTIANVNEIATSLLLQPDGKIIIAGSIALPSSVDTSFAILRYNSDGSLDTTFGNGGIVATNIGDDHDSIGAIALQPDGKIIAAGNEAFSRPPGEQRNSDIVLARYNSNGTLDSSFGNNGFVTSDFGPFPNYFADDATAVLLQPDGKIIVAGDSDGSGYFDFLVARYNDNGSLDSTFGNGGFTKTDVGNGYEDGASDAVLQPDGKIVLAGAALPNSYDLDFALVRYLPNGSPDPSFGNGGVVVFGLDNLHDEELTAIVLESDGRLVALGDSNNSGRSGFLLLRFFTDGSLDPDFGAGGIVRTPFGGNDTQTTSLALQGNKVVAAGFTPLYNTSDFALARYTLTPPESPKRGLAKLTR